MNKLTGFLVFTVPYILFLQFAESDCMIISVVAVIAAMEELIIHNFQLGIHKNRSIWNE